MVCDKVVCERWGGGGGRRRRGSDPGYRIKNKNPTQSCGEQARLSALHCFLLKNSSTSTSINLSDLTLLCCFRCDCLGPARRLSLFLSFAANDAEPLAVSFQHTAKRISCNSTLRPCVVFENVSCRPHSHIEARQQAW